jgi:glyoxylase-like metal-dependent hydrolase (beta-lactamase superfamily II)
MIQNELGTFVSNKIKAFNLEICPMLNVKIFQFNPLQENTYLVYDDQKNCLIFDPGCYFDNERDVLADFMSKNGLIPVQLWNTHCHLDHVFGNKFIHEQYGLILHIHEGEKKVLDRAPESGLMWNIPFDNYNGPINTIKSETSIDFGGEKVQILETPGHSPASISFYFPETGFVIAGDVLFRESVGRTDLPGANPDTLVKSILEKLYTLPDETIVYSGHGMPTTIGHEKRHNPFVKA